MTVADKNELSIDQLRKTTDVSALGFSTTGEIECPKQFIGQKRAVQAISFGLNVDFKGYNIFVLGHPGSGRTTYTLDRLRDVAKKRPAPSDWVYVFNFEDPGRPLAIELPAGKGKEMGDAFKELIDEMKTAISKAFEKSQYEDSKAQLVKSFQEEVNGLMEELKAWAVEKGFSLKRTPQGFVNIPLTQETSESGETSSREIQQEEFEALSEEKQKELQKNSEDVSQRTLEVLRKIRDLEKVLKDQITKLEAEICRNAITPYLQDLKAKYGGSDVLSSWMDALAENIIENFNLFVAAVKDENADIDFGRYYVNVFVANDASNGAPVVWETNPTYYNLSGKVEYESRQGYLYTDFGKIVAGAFHKANGGFLVLDAEKVLMNFMSWESLKRVLRTGEASIENLGEQYGAVPVSSLRPQPIPIDMKVVIVGTPYLYSLLQYYDPEFQKMFKIKADFDIDMTRNEETEKQMAQFVGNFVRENGSLPFDADAIAEVIEWSSRLAENQNRISTEFNKITEIIVESAAWAKTRESDAVAREDVIKAIREKRFRSNLIQERVTRAFEDGVIRIDTDGDAVGQINGLAVVDMMDYAFGHPSRITANVFMGQEGVVNIEREVKMTGPIHNKGLLILTSYLGRTYAREMPLSLSARITFEQTYGAIDGDSASSTELYCLLSALSGVPLRQEIAVTGSVDQFGNIQPIGGVNEKIEGFFEYCSVRGLTGRQGVMIPAQNVQHLMLDHVVLQAVREGKFHIWAVKTIDEGIEILTGRSAGERDENGKFAGDTIHGLTQARLWKFMEDAAKIKKLFGVTGDDPEKEENGDDGQ